MLACTITLVAITSSQAADHVSAFEMQGRLQYRGFSVQRPPFSWYLHPSEQTHTNFILRKDFPQPEHTIYLCVTLGSLPAGNTVKFSDTTRHLFGKGSERMKLLSYQQSETTLQGQSARRYVRTSQDLALSGPGRKMIMRDLGIVVLHPAFNNSVLSIRSSERAPKEELDDTTFSQADQMMSLVRIEVRPGVPAGKAH